MDKISVIIPAKNEGQIIGLCLTRLKESLSLIDNECEIIVVADSCTDRTVEIASTRFCKVLCVDFKNRSKSRNFGFENSFGDIVIFIDADTLVNQDFAQKTIDILKKTSKSVLYYSQGQIERSMMSNIYFKLINLIGRFRPTFTPTISCLRTFFLENQFDGNLKSFEDLIFMSNAYALNQTYFCDSTVYTSIRRYTKFGLFYSSFLCIRSIINPYKYEWKPIN